MKNGSCSQIGDAALFILHSMASAHSDLDDAGEIVTPTPRVKRILSSPRCLPHVAQVFSILKFVLFLETTL
jgi:DnaJ family protein C protein 13